MNSMMRAVRCSTESNSPRRSNRRSRIDKNSSTWFSQLAWVAVRCRKTWWCAGSSRNSSTLGVACAERVSKMQCSSRPAGVWHEVGEEVDEVLRPGGVGDPGGDTAVVDVQAGE